MTKESLYSSLVIVLRSVLTEIDRKLFLLTCIDKVAISFGWTMDRHVFRGKSGLDLCCGTLDVGPKRGDSGDAEVRLKLPVRVNSTT